jgi:hypothetical protein
MKKNGKSDITLFVLTLFLLFKVTGLHALSHHDEDSNFQHCEICKFSTVVNSAPLLEPETTVLSSAIIYFTKERFVPIASVFRYHNKHLSGDLFSRPPPLF